MFLLAIKTKTFRKHPQSQRQWKTRPCKLCKYLNLNFGHFFRRMSGGQPSNQQQVQSASGRWTLDRQIFGTSSQSWKLRWSESMIHSPTHKATESSNQLPVLVYHYQYLGTPSPSKTEEFSEKFQTAFDPPPRSFSESYIAIFSEIHDRSIVYNGKKVIISLIWGKFWSYEEFWLFGKN